MEVKIDGSGVGQMEVFSVVFLVPLARYSQFLLVFFLLMCVVGTCGLLVSPAPSPGEVKQK